MDIALRAIPGQELQDVPLRNSIAHVWTQLIGQAAESAIPCPCRFFPSAARLRLSATDFAPAYSTPVAVASDKHLPCASEDHIHDVASSTGLIRRRYVPIR